MCLCGNPSMVLARQKIPHLGILAARNPSFGNSGGQKSVIRDFLAARNLSFWNSGGQKSVIREFSCWETSVYFKLHVYLYVYECVYVVIILPWFLHGEKSDIWEFWRPEIHHSGILAARNPSFGNFWRPEICHSGILVARNPSFGNSGGENLLCIYMYIYMYMSVFMW